jgi:hypothetical protein
MNGKERKSLPAIDGRVAVYHRLTRQFVGWATPSQAEEILKREPNSLLLETSHKRHTPRMTLHIADVDNFVLVGRRFQLSEFMAKGYVYRERLSGDTWKGIDGEMYHVPAGHRCFAFRHSALRIGRPILDDVYARNATRVPARAA